MWLRAWVCTWLLAPGFNLQTAALNASIKPWAVCSFLSSGHGKEVKIKKSSQPFLYLLDARTNYIPDGFTEWRTLDLFPSLYINCYSCTWLSLMTVAAISTRGCRLAWGNKALATAEPNDMSLIPKTYMVERKNQIPPNCLWPLHRSLGICVLSPHWRRTRGWLRTRGAREKTGEFLELIGWPS